MKEEATLTGSFFVFRHNTTTHIRGLLYYIKITFFIFFYFLFIFLGFNVLLRTIVI